MEEKIEKLLSASFDDASESVQQEKWMTVTEFAKEYSRSRQWVYNNWRTGILTGYRLPGKRKLFFRRSEILSKFETIKFKYQQSNTNQI
jgi:hypothetical protein